MNRSDLSRNEYMLRGPLAKKGYDWWWHSFTAWNKETGKEKAFFIEYFVINPALGRDKPVFGQIPGAEGKSKPAYVMVKAGTWGEDARQIHAFYPISELKLGVRGLDITAGCCRLTEKSMQGYVDMEEKEAKKHPEYMSDAGVMSWDLSIEKKTAFHVGYGASKFFRKLNAFEMFWHAEGMKTEYKGSIWLDGEEYEVIPEKSYGYADKNWGSNFTSPWVWISSCNLTSQLTGKKLNNSVFDVGGGCPKVFKVPLKRKLLIDFNYEGTDYEFNFSKFWTKTKTTFTCNETEEYIVWKVKTENKDAIMHLICKCKKSEMLWINYEAPDGRKRHNRLWNGGTGSGKIRLYKKMEKGAVLIDDIRFSNAGCEYGTYDK
ncbi:MAG: hypothetical protein E7256_09470 [Lachnospiraceae bacterium]|nr:hypothetical protein [Lachnospiraceae bacterium]